MAHALALRQIARHAHLRRFAAASSSRRFGIFSSNSLKPFGATTAITCFEGTSKYPFLTCRNFSASPQLVKEDDLTEFIQENNDRTSSRFEELGLHPKSLKALRRQGLHKQTEIQEKTFDVILSGKDVLGRARTGTGKT